MPKTYGGFEVKLYSKQKLMPPEEKNRLEQSIEDWKKIVEENAHANLIGSLAESLVSASPSIDKASTWAAAGTAAVAGLAISNMDGLISIYSAKEIKILIGLLAASLVFSLIQKYLSVACASALIVSNEVQMRFKHVLDEFEKHEASIEEMAKRNEMPVRAGIDFNKVLDSFFDLYPKWIKFIFKKMFSKSRTDRNYGHKIIVNFYVYQGLFAFFQFILMILFIAFAAAYV